MSRWRRLSRYRYLFHRKGHGVHSPFVFELITGVIEQPHAYYYYRTMEQLRRHFNLRRPAFRPTLSRREGELLFRLANRYRPATIVVAGTAHGLVPLYLTGYSRRAQCIALDTDSTTQAEALLTYANADTVRLIRTTDYADEIAAVVADGLTVDCLYIGRDVSATDTEALFRACRPHMPDGAMTIVANIHQTRDKRRCWRQLCADVRTTAAIDLYRLGILFFRPGTHKRVYKNRMV